MMNSLSESGGVRNCDALTKIWYKIKQSSHTPDRCGETWFRKGIFYISINRPSRCPTYFVDCLKIFVNMGVLTAEKALPSERLHLEAR
jgi:hypothetical protein